MRKILDGIRQHYWRWSIFHPEDNSPYMVSDSVHRLPPSQDGNLLKEYQTDILPKSETGKGFTYCLNQEKYLRVFIDDGNVLADNYAAEGAIKGFCIGKSNWHLIDTIDGAKASAIIYSIAETAKASLLKPYNYFEHLLTEIHKHMDDKNLDFLKDLLPWSEAHPDSCKKQKQ